MPENNNPSVTNPPESPPPDNLPPPGEADNKSEKRRPKEGLGFRLMFFLVAFSVALAVFLAALASQMGLSQSLRVQAVICSDVSNMIDSTILATVTGEGESLEEAKEDAISQAETEFENNIDNGESLSDALFRVSEEQLTLACTEEQPGCVPEEDSYDGELDVVCTWDDISGDDDEGWTVEATCKWRLPGAMGCVSAETPTPTGTIETDDPDESDDPDDPDDPDDEEPTESPETSREPIVLQCIEGVQSQTRTYDGVGWGESPIQGGNEAAAVTAATNIAVAQAVLQAYGEAVGVANNDDDPSNDLPIVPPNPAFARTKIEEVMERELRKLISCEEGCELYPKKYPCTFTESVRVDNVSDVSIEINGQTYAGKRVEVTVTFQVTCDPECRVIESETPTPPVETPTDSPMGTPSF